MAFATSWSKNLTTAIKTGKYKSQAAGWLTGTTISDASSTGMVWARDANAYVCSSVMPNGVAAVQSADLGGAYYSGVISVVELQIAKGESTYITFYLSSEGFVLTFRQLGTD
jgi:hypothetical protein